MIVYAVFVISNEGRILLSENFHSLEGITDDVLLGEVITAIQDLSSETKKANTEISSVKIKGLSYHIRSFGLFRIVLVTGIPKNPEEIMQVLGFRFINEYGNVLLQTDYNLSIFDQFKETIKEFFPDEKIIDKITLIKPRMKLGVGEIFNLPTHLQKTALALISLQQASIDDIIQESGDTLTNVEWNLTSLESMGFIGKKQVNGKIIYFSSIK
ncbi:MAG: hypothetical protein JSW11_04470 [Candidatus Heimdallarchaeota archaeon]|nr:MAG: hypothetical protein JSW11_04470 [Candidatus Heimdallarchaeota archaeon]